MTVPLMIWSALTEIDSHACSVEKSIAASTANTTPAMAAPGDPSTGSRYAPVRKPTKAAMSMSPSMPMLTTPERSHISPHRAAKPIGTAYCTIR